MKQFLSPLKPYFRWLILGGTLFFLAKAFKDHWQEIATIRITSFQWSILAIAFIVTVIAYAWSACVWYLILRYFKQPAKFRWAVQTYLKTNIAKFIPGNIWHFYGRIWVVRDAGISLTAATLSVLLEPLLMAAAAALIALSGTIFGWLTPAASIYSKLPFLGVGMVLLGVHPRILNPLIELLNRLKNNTNPSTQNDGASQWQDQAEKLPPKLKSYPLIPLSGELFFVLLKGVGFIITLAALGDPDFYQLPVLFGVYSFAWLLGLVVPTPGGLGVFETTVITLLDQYFPISIILSVAAIYRVITTAAEATVAGLAWLAEKVT